MTTLTADLQAAIAKSLPEATAGEMRKFIQDAEQLKVTLAQDRELIDKNNLRIATLEKQIRLQSEVDAQLIAIAAREKDLEKRENILLQKTVQNEAVIARAELAATHLVMDKFLKLPSVRTNISRNVAVPVEGMAPTPMNQYGSPGGVQNAQESECTTMTPE